AAGLVLPEVVTDLGLAHPVRVPPEQRPQLVGGRVADGLAEDVPGGLPDEPLAVERFVGQSSSAYTRASRIAWASARLVTAPKRPGRSAVSRPYSASQSSRAGSVMPISRSPAEANL